MPFRYPISLELAGRSCVVIGGGQVAEHKVGPLLEAGAAVTVIAKDFSDGLEELARRCEVKLRRKSYSPGDLEGAFLAVAATDDSSVNAAIFEEAEDRRVLLNAVDDPTYCHFAVPSIVKQADFMIAISTGGKAPALSKRLRQSLARQFGPEYGVLVELLGEVREELLPGREVDFDTWAGRWAEALGEDLIGLIRQGRLDEAKRCVSQLVSSGERGIGKVCIVGAGPGDPGLITMRGMQVVDSADVVVHDRLVDPSLFEGKNSIYVGKVPGSHSISQEEINALLIRLAREGLQVVRLKGGDPFVFGRGAEEAEALEEAGVHVEIVPGLTSATAVLSRAGIPLTDRRFSSSVAFVTGHRAGGRADWSVASSVDTLVILMGVDSLGDIVEAVLAEGVPPTRPAAIVENGTLRAERVLVCELGDLHASAITAGIRSPAVICIGEVVSLRKSMKGEEREQRIT